MTKRRAVKKHVKPVFSHPRHSGKRLPHHHTGFLPLLILLIFTGFLLVGITHTVKADSNIVVVGRIPAELPPAAAVISAPVNGVVFTAIPIDVQGTCPAGYLVKLNRNDVFSGSTLCGATGTFSMQTDLFTGNNALTAHIYNITDDEGPQSPAVNVSYDPPIPPSAPTSHAEDQAPQEATALPVFILKADSSFKGYVVGDEIEWQLDIEGGSAPYALNVDWGDGKSTVVSRKEAGKFSIHHSYDMPGGYKGSFNIKLTGSDSLDQKVFLQLLVIVNLPFNSSNKTTGSTTSKPEFSLKNIDAKTLIWTSYSISLVTVASFWFGGQWQFHHSIQQSRNFKRTIRRT